MAKGPIFKNFMSKCSLDHEKSNDIKLMRYYCDLLLYGQIIAHGVQFSGARGEFSQN